MAVATNDNHQTFIAIRGIIMIIWIVNLFRIYSIWLHKGIAVRMVMQLLPSCAFVNYLLLNLLKHTQIYWKDSP